jgi:hypothetical protein
LPPDAAIETVATATRPSRSARRLTTARNLTPG